MRRSRFATCAASVVAACGFSGSLDPNAIDAPVIDSSIDAPPIDAPRCPAEYASLGAASQSVYRVSGGPMGAGSSGRSTWEGANADCNDDGAFTHLAIPETMQEHQMFVDVLSGASRWLGVVDRKAEGSWVTVTGGTAFWTYWTQPYPMNSTYDCLILTRVPSHEDSECNKPGDTNEWLKGYICECDGKAIDATTF